MPNFEDTFNQIDPFKGIVVGKTGSGKSGALASLAAMGYKLRILDTDKGTKPLRTLLTDRRYPYADIMEANGHSLREAVSYIPIDIKMGMRMNSVRKPDGSIVQEKVIGPLDATSWTKAMDALAKWNDGTTDYGNISTWGPDTVLVLDTFSTLAKMAYYNVQALNGRLGGREQGNDYRRDVGEAQGMLTRLLELLHASSLNTNVIIFTHITWIEEKNGVAGKPKGGEDGKGKDDDDTGSGYIEGLPAAVGRALAPVMGKYFNDMYHVRSFGSGEHVTRTISTVPQDGVSGKNSVFLAREYPISSGMAEIFAIHRGEPLDQGTIMSLRAKPKQVVSAKPPAKA
jgi:hypothetical protein